MIVCIMDTETTGLPKPYESFLNVQPKIIEACAILYNEDGSIIKEHLWRYNPGYRLPPEITRITGLVDADLVDCPRWDRKAHDYWQNVFLQAGGIVAHNLPFDRDMFEFEADRLGLKFEWPKMICTVEQSEHILGRRMRLIELYEYLFNEPLNQTHRAKDDVEALARCYFELVKRGDV